MSEYIVSPLSEGMHELETSSLAELPGDLGKRQSRNADVDRQWPASFLPNLPELECCTNGQTPQFSEDKLAMAFQSNNSESGCPSVGISRRSTNQSFGSLESGSTGLTSPSTLFDSGDPSEPRRMPGSLSFFTTSEMFSLGQGVCDAFAQDPGPKSLQWSNNTIEPVYQESDVSGFTTHGSQEALTNKLAASEGHESWLSRLLFQSQMDGMFDPSRPIYSEAASLVTDYPDGIAAHQVTHPQRIEDESWTSASHVDTAIRTQTVVKLKRERRALRKRSLATVVISTGNGSDEAVMVKCSRGCGQEFKSTEGFPGRRKRHEQDSCRNRPEHVVRQNRRVCDAEGCSRDFSRSDHLRDHKRKSHPEMLAGKTRRPVLLHQSAAVQQDTTYLHASNEMDLGSHEPFN